MRSLPGLTVLAGVVSGLPLTAQAMARDSVTAPLAIDSVLSTRTFARLPITLSPGGAWVAYTVEETRRVLPHAAGRIPVADALVQEDVYVTSLASQETIQLTAGEGASWAPAWSPDGALLAYCSDRDGAPRVWLWDPRTRRSRRAAGVRVRPGGAGYARSAGVGYGQVLQWSRDSHTLLVAAAADSSRAATADRREGERTASPLSRDTNGTTVTVLTATPSGTGPADTSGYYTQDADTRSARADLVHIDVRSGQVEMLARGYNLMWYGISPDGQTIAFATANGQWRGNDWRNGYDLFARDPDGKMRTIVHDIRSANVYPTWGWSPDGKCLSYFHSDSSGNTSEIYVVPVAGGAARKVSGGPHPPSDWLPSWMGPLWAADGRHLYVGTEDGTLRVLDVASGMVTDSIHIPGHRIIAVLTPHRQPTIVPFLGTPWALVATRNDSTRQSGFFAVDLTTHAARQLQEGNVAYPAVDAELYFDATPDGRTVLFSASDPWRAADLWRADTTLQSPRQVTDLNPWVRLQPLGESRLISWRSADGEVLHGSLLLPAGSVPGRRYPLVALVYAGGRTFSDWVYEFGLWRWGVLNNMQLLATRGYAVLLPDQPQHVGTPMMDIAKTLIPAVDRVIEMGIADPERLGVMGHSYGGYTTLSAIVQTTRFKAAVVRSGLVDLIADYGMMGADGSAFAIGVAEDGQELMRGTPWQYRERYLENSPVYYLDRVQTPVLIIHGTDDDIAPVAQGDELFVDLRRLGNVQVQYARYAGEGHVLEKYANQRDYLNRMIGWFDRFLKAPTASAQVRGSAAHP